MQILLVSHPQGTKKQSCSTTLVTKSIHNVQQLTCLKTCQEKKKALLLKFTKQLHVIELLQDTSSPYRFLKGPPKYPTLPYTRIVKNASLD